MFCSRGLLSPFEVKKIFLKLGAEEIEIPPFCRLPIKYIVKWEGDFWVIGNQIFGWCYSLSEGSLVHQVPSIEFLVRLEIAHDSLHGYNAALPV